MHSRRQTLIGLAAAAVAGCARDAEWCDTPQLTDDGDFPYPGTCALTADDIEGPYYLSDAPERSNLDLYGDTGTPLTLSGQVYDSSCDQPIIGAIVEFWQADPDGEYDNSSDEMRYRCQITTDSEGRYSLTTLLPGRYLNGTVFRPRHIHVRVIDADGSLRLTTQLYFEGDPYIDCDSFVNTSLVVPSTGTEDTEMVAEDVWFVV